jgi:oxalate decarboxylase/phosphoglucose isomerase-like protein (cupin superfamily)
VVSARGRIDPCIKATRAGAGRGIHVHPGQVEHFRVLQGRLTVLVGEQALTLGPGDERSVMRVERALRACTIMRRRT